MKRAADESTAPTMVNAGHAKTVNLFLRGVNGDANGNTPTKVAELQFAAQPQSNAFLNNAAQAYYSYPANANPFAVSPYSAYGMMR